MNHYLLVLRGGQGCDYAIDCGLTTIDIVAESYHEAERKAVDIIIGTEDGEGYHDEREIKLAMLYTVCGEMELDVKGMYGAYDAKNAEIDRAWNEQKEREVFARLMKKYG